jgi:hypothetical protein
MHLLVKLVWSPWFWADVFFSVIGAVIVYRGHKISLDAEKLIPPQDFKKDIFGDIVIRYKEIMDKGHRTVMIGVVIEAIAALVLSVLSGLAIADSNERAAKLEDRATIAESNVVAMKLKLQDRHVTDRQKKILASVLANATKGAVMVGTRHPDRETTTYASEIALFMSDMGFTIKSSINYFDNIYVFNQNSSIGIIVDNFTNSPPNTALFNQAFGAADMNPTLFPMLRDQFGSVVPVPGTNDVLLLIVEKP